MKYKTLCTIPGNSAEWKTVESVRFEDASDAGFDWMKGRTVGSFEVKHNGIRLLSVAKDSEGLKVRL